MLPSTSPPPAFAPASGERACGPRDRLIISRWHLPTCGLARTQAARVQLLCRGQSKHTTSCLHFSPIPFKRTIHLPAASPRNPRAANGNLFYCAHPPLAPQRRESANKLNQLKLVNASSSTWDAAPFQCRPSNGGQELFPQDSRISDHFKCEFEQKASSESCAL